MSPKVYAIRNEILDIDKNIDKKHWLPLFSTITISYWN